VDALTVFMLARVSILRPVTDPIIHFGHRNKLNGQAKMLSKLKTPFSESALICDRLAFQTVKIRLHWWTKRCSPPPSGLSFRMMRRQPTSERGPQIHRGGLRFTLQNKAPRSGNYLTRCTSFVGKFKFVAFVEANKQRAKILTRAFRLGVSADNKFLLLMELELDPSSAALSGLKPGTGAFTD
jgi:hypothetical protein